MTKVCQSCYRRFEARRADARYCSPACRQKAYRQRQPRRSRAEAAAAQLEGRRRTSHRWHCKHCGREFSTDGTGTARLYCSNACRQAAYRERKKRARLEAELVFLARARAAEAARLATETIRTARPET